MGIEPTQDASAAPANGFEDRGPGVRDRPFESDGSRLALAGSDVRSEPTTRIRNTGGCRLRDQSVAGNKPGCRYVSRSAAP
jgi:hypothetical protein